MKRDSWTQVHRGPRLAPSTSTVTARTRGGARRAVSFGLAITLVAFGLSLTAAPQSAQAAPGDPFPATDPFVFISQDSPTQLYRAQTDPSGTVSFQPEGGPSPVTYNAISYRTADNYLYGIAGNTTAGVPNGSLIRIGQGGVVTRVGTSTFSSTGAQNVGAFGPNGYLYVMSGITGTMNVIDVQTGALVTTRTLSSVLSIADWTFANGYFWSTRLATSAPNSSNLLRINPATGQVTTFSYSLPNGAYGAAWTFGNGNLGFSDNNTGNVYQVSVTNPGSANPTFAIVATSPGPQSGLNDGAASPGLPTDLGIVKTGPSAFVPGGTITYTLTVTNHGAGNSSGFTVSDTIPAPLTNVTTSSPGCTVVGNVVTCSGGRTLVGGTATYQITATVPASATACITNTGRVTANESDPNPGNNTSSVQSCPATMSLVKSAGTPTDVNNDGLVDEGDTIPFSFAVTNTGQVPITALTIDDPKVGAVSCPTTSIAVGATVTCTATYTISAADVASGAVDNTATASGVAGTTPVTSNSSSTSTPTEAPAPELTLVKSVSPSDAASFTVGQVLEYSFHVTNTGNVALTDIGIDEVSFTGAGGSPTVSCPGGTLAVDASVTCTASYTVLQADVDRGDIDNTATAHGTAPDGGTVTSNEASATTPADQAPALALTKTATPSTVTAPGQTVTYSFLVENTGNVTLSGIGIAEVAFTGTGTLSAVSCVASTLVPGQTTTCSASYSTTQADIDAGQITNTAQATAEAPNGDPVASNQSTAIVAATAMPALTIQKSASLPDGAQYQVGEVVDYSFVLTNTGNVTLLNVGVTETMFTGAGTMSAVACPSGAAALAPDDSVTCSATYALQQGDIDRGSVENTAVGRANTPAGTPVTTSPSSAIVPIDAEADLTLVKTADATTITSAGETVRYSFEITNTGAVTVYDATIAEGSFTGTGDLSDVICPPAADVVAPGDSVTCSATYTATQADVDAGAITNTATATGTTLTGSAVESGPAEATVTAAASPELTIVKSASPNDAASFVVGQQIQYSFVVRNTGNVTLTEVEAVESAFTGSGPAPEPACPPSAAVLAPNASITCHATYTLTQADVDRGTVDNTAIATGTAPDGSPVESEPSSVGIPGIQSPALTLTKTASPAVVRDAGTTIEYGFLVVNSGNVTVSGISVTETAFSGAGTMSAIACPPAAASLAPNESARCTATYTVQQADIDAGTITNSALATGSAPNGDPVTSAPDDAVVTAVSEPSIELTKSVQPNDAASFVVGQVLTYSFVVRNTGNVTLTNAAVDEQSFTGSGAMSAITCPPAAASLAPRAFVTCQATYTVTQADVDQGSVQNTATARATVPSSGDEIASPLASAMVPGLQDPAVSLDKSVSPTLITGAGQTVTYAFEIVNEGNVTLTEPGVDEVDFTGTGAMSAIQCPTGVSVLPGQSVTCEATYTATQADINAGRFTNTATARMTAPNGDTVTTAESSAIVQALQAPSLTLDKSVSPPAVTAAGDSATYAFEITNTGNVTLQDAGVAEIFFSGTGGTPTVQCPASAASVDPGQSVTCSATYEVTQADVDAGRVTNQAVAFGTPSGQSAPVTSQMDDAIVTVDATPSLALVKTASPSTAAGAGSTVSYSFLLTNTGNVTLANVGVEEVSFTGTGSISAVSCPPGATSLAPDASVTCTATYTLTQADADSGGVTNTAVGVGTPPNGADPVSSEPSTAAVAVVAAPSLALQKSASPSDADSFRAGQVITYSFLVRNTGNVTLTDIGIDEVDFTGSGDLSAITCPPAAATLAPDAMVTCSATYTLAQADVDAEHVTNSATARGTTPGGTSVTSSPSEVTIPGEATPSMGFTKTPSSETLTHAGQVITYSFAITNTGNVTLLNVGVAEGAFSGTGELSPVTCPAAASELLPGDRVTCTATYTVTAADLASGRVSNTATATGETVGGDPIGSNPSTAAVSVLAVTGVSGALFIALGVVGAAVIAAGLVLFVVHRRRSAGSRAAAEV